MKKYLALGLISVFALSLLFVFQNSKFYDGRLHMVACDVGQGDSIFIRTESKADILIDGGPDDKVLDCLNNNMPFWDKTLEVVILTHPDSDHLRGLVSVFERYKVNHYVTVEVLRDTGAYKLLQNKLKQKNITPKYLKAGQAIKFGNTEFKLFWPQENFSGKEVNEYSIVGKLTYLNFSALLTGDAEANILDRLSLGDVNVLKVPHHGGKAGMSERFLSIVTPELAIISAGKNNSYGHPAALSLELLNKFQIKTLRTDLDGEVEVVSDGQSYWLN